MNQSAVYRMLLAFSLLLSGTKAGWWSDTWEVIETGLEIAHVMYDAFGKRGMEPVEPPDEHIREMLDEACPDIDLGPDVPMAAFAHIAFSKVDKNKDGSLDEAESNRFVKVIEVINYCAELNKKSQQ